jgi:hypothetical protein
MYNGIMETNGFLELFFLMLGFTSMLCNTIKGWMYLLSIVLLLDI